MPLFSGGMCKKNTFILSKLPSQHHKETLSAITENSHTAQKLILDEFWQLIFWIEVYLWIGMINNVQRHKNTHT